MSRIEWPWARLAVGMALCLTMAWLLLAVVSCYPTPQPAPRPPTPAWRPTPEPLVPTPLAPVASPSRPAPAGTPSPWPPKPLPTVAAPDTDRAFDRSRIGVGLPLATFGDYDWGGALPGWYLNWHVQVRPALLPGTRFVQMMRVSGDSYRPDLPTLRAAVAANSSQLWLIGNEPDVAWQDNATPEQYAATYGILYRAIKATDPTAQVAIGGVSVPTPLRLAYLDRILSAYRVRYGEPMPVDVWNVHAFILREERDSWGVGIPPGMAEARGQIYEINDHDDMAIFRQQIVDFRRWMADRGFREKALVVSEYGVLMPESYGFPVERVADFMIATFDYFLTARDPLLGYPADDNRLVQSFCWYSVSDTVYPTPNLFDPETRRITPVGEVFRAYVSALR